MNGAVITLAVFGLPMLIAISAMWRGYVLSILWGWFVVPVFALPALSVPIAIGLSLLVGFLTNHRTGNEAEDEKDSTSKIATSITVALLGPAFVLLFGWIVTKFL